MLGPHTPSFRAGTSASSAFTFRDGALKLAKTSELLNVVWHRPTAMPLQVRSWTCPACGTVDDRDVNAARNILAAGVAER